MKLDEFVLENWLNPAANSPKKQKYIWAEAAFFP